VGKAVAASIVAFVLSVSLVVGDLLGAHLPAPLALPPFFLAGGAFTAVLYTINDRRFGTIQPSRIWAVLRELPTAVLVVLGILLVAQIASNIWNALHPGVHSDADSSRTEATVVAWISLVAGALAVGVQRQRRRAMAGTLRPMDERSIRRVRRVYGGLFATAVAVTVASALPGLVEGGETVFDQSSVHTELANRYAGTVWAPHLTAANTYHARFQVFLDTDDPVILDAACQSLSPYAALVGRVASLYVARHGRGRFARTCA
jgi:hypothetical protein